MIVENVKKLETKKITNNGILRHVILDIPSYDSDDFYNL